jgi:hypothetical protein
MPALAQRADIVRRAAYVRFVWGKSDMTGKRRDSAFGSGPDLHYSAICSPDLPNSAGKSLNFVVYRWALKRREGPQVFGKIVAGF